ATGSRLKKTALVIAASFGFFQGGMTIAGWIAGASFSHVISAYDHWIAFLLLAGIGIKMIYDSIQGKEEAHFAGLAVIPVILLSVATSIDALAVGVSLGVLETPVLVPALVIGMVCFAFSCTGVMCGMRLEKILGNRTGIAGGAILILIGVQILTEIFPL
ncbi:MAG: manganese efflux pump MntP family protein, partial [Methanoregula sp.]|nr:manganese efflux pump MntP family protein [Methanoregula sp.]